MSTSPSTLQQQYQQMLAQQNPYASTAPAVNAGPYGNPYASTTPGLATSDTVNNSNFYNDQSIEYQQENQLEGQAQAQESYYGPLQEQAQQQEEAALGQLQAQPGYAPQQASEINADYSQYNTPQSALQNEYLTPQQQSAIQGNTAAAQEANASGEAGEGAMLNQYQANLSGELGNYDTGTGAAVSNLDTGVQGAQSNFSGLNAAAGSFSLNFNPNGAEQEITPAEEQEMQTAAGQRIGAQYQTAEDTLNRNAAAAGNTSPLALAAANARLQTQEASDQGNAEVTANLAAIQAQEQQATSIEGQREQAAQYQTGLQANASTTEEAAAQNAASLAGTQGISAAENEGQQDINAANEYGQTSVNEANTLTGQSYGAANTADTENAARAALLGQNQQATTENINNTEYAQGTGSQQMTAAGATNVGQTAIAGQGAYRSGVAQQQALNQQGGQTAMGQQQTAASTLGSQLNQSEANAGAFKNQSPTLAGQAAGVIGSVAQLANTGANAAGGGGGGAAKGGVFTEPTEAIIGERGPEAVVPIGPPRYRPNHKRSIREAA